MATPVLNWLRSVALAVRDGGYLGTWLRANDLVDIISQKPDTELPGLPEGADMTDEEVKKKVLQAVGRRMAQCFGAADRCEVDSFLIERESLDDTAHSRTVKRYNFTIGKPDSAASPYAPLPKLGDRGTVTRQGAEMAAEAGDETDGDPSAVTGAVDSPYRPPMRPLCDSPMKTQCSPIAPMGSEIARGGNLNSHAFQRVCEKYAGNKEVIEPIGGIGESGEASAVAIEDEEEELV